MIFCDKYTCEAQTLSGVSCLSFHVYTTLDLVNLEICLVRFVRIDATVLFPSLIRPGEATWENTAASYPGLCEDKRVFMYLTRTFWLCVNTLPMYITPWLGCVYT